MGRVSRLRPTHLQRWVSEISNLGQPASTFGMPHPHKLHEVPGSTTHVLQADQANPTGSGPFESTLRVQSQGTPAVAASRLGVLDALGTRSWRKATTEGMLGRAEASGCRQAAAASATTASCSKGTLSSARDPSRCSYRPGPCTCGPWKSLAAGAKNRGSGSGNWKDRE